MTGIRKTIFIFVFCMIFFLGNIVSYAADFSDTVEVLQYEDQTSSGLTDEMSGSIETDVERELDTKSNLQSDEDQVALNPALSDQIPEELQNGDRVKDITPDTPEGAAIDSEQAVADLFEESPAVETPVQVAKPVLKSASCSAKGIRIIWGSADNAVKYRVYRKTSTGKWKALADTTACSFVDTSAEIGSLYYYTVSAFGTAEQKSGYDKKGIAAVRLKAVPVISAQNTNKAINITWNKVKLADGYRIYRRMPDGKWKKLKDIKKAGTFEDTSVENGITYEYAIKPYKIYGKKKYLGYFADKHVASVVRLKKPKLAEAVSANGGIQITWGKVKGAASYLVYYKDSSAAKWRKLAATDSTTFLDKTVRFGDRRYYTVLAKNRSSKSLYSKNGISAVYVKKCKLTSLTASGTIAKMSWSKVSRVTGYRIYRKADGGKWKKLADVQAVLSYTDRTIQYGITYSYRIQAYKKDGKEKYLSCWDEECFSAVLSLKTPDVQVCQLADNSFSVSWEKVKGAKKYRLYRKSPGTSWEKVRDLTGTEYVDDTVLEGIAYSYAVKALNGTFKSGIRASESIKIPAELELPVKRYLNLGWNVDPRSSGGPADYGCTTTKVNTKYWTNHVTYQNDDYKPQAGDIITYGHPDDKGNTQGHVDLCVKSYDEKTGKFGVISGNWGSYFTSSPIAYVDKSWKSYKKSADRPICNIWECKLSAGKKSALINSAYKMLSSYQENPDYTRNLILSCKYTNWCDVFVAYVIFIAR